MLQYVTQKMAVKWKTSELLPERYHHAWLLMLQSQVRNSQPPSTVA
jgi:hypothetical protein